MHYSTGADVTIPVGDETAPLLIQGDTKFVFKDHDIAIQGKDDNCFHCWLHTNALLRTPRLELRRADCDRAAKKKEAKHYPPNFALVIETELTDMVPADDGEDEASDFDYDDRTDDDE